MKHYLLTRFNLRVKNWNHTRSGQKVLDEKWMTDRMYLFERYCFPSVINQSNQNFKWLIFLEKETDDRFKTKLKQLCEGYEWIVLNYVDDGRHYKKKMIEYIREDKEDAEYILTSRIDNDDLIHKDYINIIQKAYKANHNLVIDFPNGYQVIKQKTSYQCSHYVNDFNPFISLVEYAADFATVYKAEHKSFKSNDHICSIEKTGMWIELVHNLNMKNERDYETKKTKFILGEDFGLSFDLKNEQKFSIMDLVRQMKYKLGKKL